MNILSSLTKNLLYLKQDYDLLAIKSEFEAEGSSLEEVSFLSDICLRSKIDLTIKVGGAQAQRDFYEACQLGVSTLLVPMIESGQSLLNAHKIFMDCKSSFSALFKPQLAINIESISGYERLDEICQYIQIYKVPINKIVIGRTDLAGSLGIANVNDLKLIRLIDKIIEKIEPMGVFITIGGSMTSESYQNLSFMKDNRNMAFETRKCTLPSHLLNNKVIFDSALKLALEFEFNWLTYKSEINKFLDQSDKARIYSIQKRLTSSS